MNADVIAHPLHVLSNKDNMESMLDHNEVLMIRREDMTIEASELHLKLSEETIDSLDVDRKKQKRMFFIVVEALQNITRHKDECIDHHCPDTMLAIGRHKGNPYVLTANVVKNDKVSELESKLSELTKMDPETLQAIYRETLKNGEISSAGGANLGLIEIIRKANGDIQYGFDKLNEQLSYFILKINIV